MDPCLEIRKLPPSATKELARILEYADSWKTLMAVIPATLEADADFAAAHRTRYNSDHIQIIEQASRKDKRSSPEILFDEWGTCGRVRPNLGHLFHLLVKAELFRAADFVAVDLLRREPPQRPATGPSAQITDHRPGKIGNRATQSGESANTLGIVAAPLSDFNGLRSDLIVFSTEENARDTKDGDVVPNLSVLLN
ncbi:protein Tube-like [Cylas formicarius]|uniref:protein Tube-like n=1 Tax=Cylas formicarius TaxID=197179 RepID=UPI0029588E24|nr:protein Tube-like [Cylas formicarius]